jgi:hypothetical protein
MLELPQTVEDGAVHQSGIRKRRTPVDDAMAHRLDIIDGAQFADSTLDGRGTAPDQGGVGAPVGCSPIDHDVAIDERRLE